MADSNPNLKRTWLDRESSSNSSNLNPKPRKNRQKFINRSQNGSQVDSTLSSDSIVSVLTQHDSGRHHTSDVIEASTNNVLDPIRSHHGSFSSSASLQQRLQNITLSSSTSPTFNRSTTNDSPTGISQPVTEDRHFSQLIQDAETISSSSLVNTTLDETLTPSIGANVPSSTVCPRFLKDLKIFGDVLANTPQGFRNNVPPPHSPLPNVYYLNRKANVYLDISNVRQAMVTVTNKLRQVRLLVDKKKLFKQLSFLFIVESYFNKPEYVSFNNIKHIVHQHCLDYVPEEFWYIVFSLTDPSQNVIVRDSLIPLSQSFNYRAMSSDSLVTSYATTSSEGGSANSGNSTTVKPILMARHLTNSPKMFFNTLSQLIYEIYGIDVDLAHLLETMGVSFNVYQSDLIRKFNQFLHRVDANTTQSTLLHRGNLATNQRQVLLVNSSGSSTENFSFKQPIPKPRTNRQKNVKNSADDLDNNNINASSVNPPYHKRPWK
jgi:hypothetical protein